MKEAIKYPLKGLREAVDPWQELSPQG